MELTGSGHVPEDGTFARQLYDVLTGELAPERNIQVRMWVVRLLFAEDQEAEALKIGKEIGGVMHKLMVVLRAFNAMLKELGVIT